jgi:hypothetical protein
MPRGHRADHLPSANAHLALALALIGVAVAPARAVAFLPGRSASWTEWAGAPRALLSCRLLRRGVIAMPEAP